MKLCLMSSVNEFIHTGTEQLVLREALKDYIIKCQTNAENIVIKDPQSFELFERYQERKLVAKKVLKNYTLEHELDEIKRSISEPTSSKEVKG